ncbi:hypothetical protein IWQ60_003900 [Tieghemiomyces parasiticus]|uniref:Aminotransferase class I/classII large domain-containing protein n=1 Tax=Tieghemiomyces parasiticus TaxID=78921 RepID=A0A9W8DW06_9FUNG|nr:hypothetical protein IWQ60_003900 [Tieghemiomyces parasiticus]
MPPIAKPSTVKLQRKSLSVNHLVDDDSTHTLPLALDLTDYLGDARRRGPTPLEALQPLALLPDMMSLSIGLPPAGTFPIRSLVAGAPVPDPQDKHAPDGCYNRSDQKMTTLRLPFYPPPDVPDALATSMAAVTLCSALQYGSAEGSAPLLDFLRDHVRAVHHPPYEDWDLIATTGNTDALAKALGLIGSPGDYLLVDEWTYPSTVDAAQSHGIHLVPVPMDHDGMRPAALDNMLTTWPLRDRRPKMLYLIPTGHNPTGITMSVERRRAIYALAQKHRLIIFEDDPYFYFQFPAYGAPAVYDDSEDSADPDADLGLERLDLDGKAAGTTALPPLIPSFLSLDTDGRVLRMDSFSKIFAPGTRLGWITTSVHFIPYIAYHTQTTNHQPSGFSQAIVADLLLHKWRADGWCRHLRNLRNEYLRRRDQFVALAIKHLAGLAEFTIPEAGMFVWLRLLLPKRLASGSEGDGGRPVTREVAATTITMDDVLRALVDARVMAIPGFYFAGQLNRAERRNAPYLRVSFSFARPEDFDPALMRLAGVLRRFGCGQGRLSLHHKG